MGISDGISLEIPDLRLVRNKVVQRLIYVITGVRAGAGAGGALPSPPLDSLGCKVAEQEGYVSTEGSCAFWCPSKPQKVPCISLAL